MFSQLLRAELSNAFRGLAARPHMRATLDPALIAKFELDEWPRSEVVRRGWLQYASTELDRLLGRFAEVLEYPLNQNVLEFAESVMARCDLRSFDAIHVATARLYGAHLLATVDEAIRKAAPDLTVLLVRDALET